jgi:hypothetical protein
MIQSVLQTSLLPRTDIAIVMTEAIAHTPNTQLFFLESLIFTAGNLLLSDTLVNTTLLVLHPPTG